MANTNPDGARAWPVLEIRNVRAPDAEAAVAIAETDLDTAVAVDTGEAGHVAGGRVIGLAEVNDAEDAWLDPRTANQGLIEAAINLIQAANQEGDDGTGGLATIETVEHAILWAQEALEAMKEARS